MRHFLKFVFIALPLLFNCNNSFGQSGWTSPEAEKLYYKGRDLLSNGELEQAINTYREAAGLEPAKMIIQRDLGKAYYFNKNYNAAIAALDNVINSKEADDQAYQFMADCQRAKGDNKQAIATLKKGIALFPVSGLLYHEAGKFYEEDGDIKNALDAWLDGIHLAPAYHVNYYEAARIYSGTNKVIWVILYGEIFVNLEPETQRADDARKMILAAYKQLLTIAPSEMAELQNTYTVPANFEKAFYATYTKFPLLMNDDMSAENMIIFRSRFIMDWYTHYADQYPFSLFAYCDASMKNGDFDVYNQWLFGKVINEKEYRRWLQSNSAALEDFKKRRATHLFKPQSSDFYNDKNLDQLFGKKRR